MTHKFFGIAILLLSACTAPNPNYIPLQRTDGTGSGDAIIIGGDGGQLPADQRTPDILPSTCSSDQQCDDKNSCTDQRCENNKCVVSAKADNISCDDDGLDCTRDRCHQGKCQHAVQPGFCAISGNCIPEQTSDPSNSCQLCQPNASSSAWTPSQDGIACEDDGLSCTTDLCSNGKCAHQAATGCFIGGQCYDEGDAHPQDACAECQPTVNASDFVFAAGKPCTSASGFAAMCVKNACRSWQESKLDPVGGGAGNVTRSGLSGVTYIPSAQQVWAAGDYRTAQQPGLGWLVQLTKPSQTISAPYRFNALHLRVAVGQQGQVYYFDNSSSTWAPEQSLHTQLSGYDRTSIWGYQTNNSGVYFIGGLQQSPLSSAILRCDGTPGQFFCAPQLGFPNTLVTGALSGFYNNNNGNDKVWAVPQTGPEHVYVGSSKSATWSAAAPDGCVDNGAGSNTPCSNTPGDYKDIFVAADHTVWAVGDFGLLMHHDGVSWNSLPAVIKEQDYWLFDAVFSSSADGLTTIVGHRDISDTTRRFGIINYNHKLKKWFGPIFIEGTQAASNLEAAVRDIGGNDYSNLWIVGAARFSGSGGPGGSRVAAWVLRLQ